MFSKISQFLMGERKAKLHYFPFRFGSLGSTGSCNFELFSNSAVLGFVISPHLALYFGGGDLVWRLWLNSALSKFTSVWELSSESAQM